VKRGMTRPFLSGKEKKKEGESGIASVKVGKRAENRLTFSLNKKEGEERKGHSNREEKLRGTQTSSNLR